MRIAVLGVGLIGGSVGLAARERVGADVTGWGPRAPTLEAARERGAVDTVATTVADAVADADAVFACGPVETLPELVREALAAAPGDCVVTDVGSTKRPLVDAIDDERFCGGHPIAGAETAGVQNARADLFADAGSLREWNDGAREDRRRLLEAGIAGGPLHELRLSVPNRPGIVAQVARALGKAGLNIADMALAPAPDMRSGSMTLWVAGDAD